MPRPGDGQASPERTFAYTWDVENDSDPPRRRRSTVPRTVRMGQRFWQQAERDLETARRLIGPDTYYAAASFAHQAAEKALKAACWHLRAEEPPWRHDLGRTFDLV